MYIKLKVPKKYYIPIKTNTIAEFNISIDF